MALGSARHGVEEPADGPGLRQQEEYVTVTWLVATSSGAASSHARLTQGRTVSGLPSFTSEETAPLSLCLWRNEDEHEAWNRAPATRDGGPRPPPSPVSAAEGLQACVRVRCLLWFKIL